MSDWSEELGYLLKKAGRTAGSAVRAVKSVLDDDPHEVLCYRGFGNRTQSWTYGRIVEKRDIGASTEGDSTLRNLLNTYRRADSDPVPRAGVEVTREDATRQMKADDEGYFGRLVDFGLSESDKEWQEYSVELVSPPNPAGDPVKGTGEILNPPKSAKFGVISDIDDTVIQSRVSSFLLAARTVMLGNARTRLPFPGVAAFYRAMREGLTGDEKNPIFYVSSSPWNIYDVISEFMELQNIPKGPIILRDWDIDLNALSASRHLNHKGVAIRNILGVYPTLPFILIGDSSQHDPEIYRQIVAEFPGRILAIYIRDVVRSAERSSSIKKLAEEIVAANSILVLADDTLGAARHAAEHKWINEKALPGIGEEKRADEGTDGTKAPAPEGGKPGTSAPPTVVGES
ncbi:MAG: phosphatase domain-containing protein [Gemmatimonadales bacterium]